MASFRPSCRPSCLPSRRPSRRPSRSPSSLSFLLKIRVITIATLPTLSVTIAIAKDAPEISAAIATGLCESQPSPYQNATDKQTSNEDTNSPQNAPPIVLTFSLMEPPIDLATLASQPRILFPLRLRLYHKGTDLIHRCYLFACSVSSTTNAPLMRSVACIKCPNCPVHCAKSGEWFRSLTPLRATPPR